MFKNSPSDLERVQDCLDGSASELLKGNFDHISYVHHASEGCS